MNKTVENYFLKGCGRCPLGGTSDCKVHNWVKELELLRNIVLDCGLTEECKWGVPCYVYQDKNVAIISAFKDYCSISFFKGALLNDAEKVLEKPGKNSQAVRLIKFTSVDEIKKNEFKLREYLNEAVEVEKANLKVEFKKDTEPIPEELSRKFDKDPILKAAFEALTLGRQKGYILYFSGPKQSKTKESRIEKCIGKILNGEGLNDKGRSREF